MDINSHLNAKGNLKVSRDHKIYWEDWGSETTKIPILYLHGGPGYGFSDKNKLFFNPIEQRVIFFDQRGAGRSIPSGNLSENTTQNLLLDIDNLLSHLKIKKVSLVGGSWGSALALSYAIHNPNIVNKMLLWGIFLARKKDINYLSQGGAKSHFPDAWQRYDNMVPDIEKDNTSGYYLKEFNHRERFVRDRYIKEWSLYESSLASINSQPSRLALQEIDDTVRAGAKIEAHYMQNRCFLSENHILKNAKKISSIPTIIVHGRFDFVCPPSGAFELADKLGKKVRLHIVGAGHSSSDPVLGEVIKAYAYSL